MKALIPDAIRATIGVAHSSWLPVIEHGLYAVAAADPRYLPELATDAYLPTEGRLFAAFSKPLHEVRYVLVGEGPYPRPESATGVCFMDGAVEVLWSEKGLSKEVNRATSLRNFIKMLLVADGAVSEGSTSGDALTEIAARARQPGSEWIHSLTALQANLLRNGFLLLNASLVFRQNVPPVREARAWQPFFLTVLEALARRENPDQLPVLVLWGKVARQLRTIEMTSHFPQAISEHPYNLSFIKNRRMQQLFGPMHLLRQH